MDERDLDATGRLLFEAGALKRVPRSGWSLLGIRGSESVADHTFRTAVVGWCLAQLAGADADRTVSLCLFHDLAEARTGDPHALARRYVGTDGEDRAGQELRRGLPDLLAGPLGELQAQYGAAGSLEARLAQDADRLECLLGGLEYEASGVASARVFVEAALARLETPVARALAQRCMTLAPDDWWLQALAPSTGAAP